MIFDDLPTLGRNNRLRHFVGTSLSDIDTSSTFVPFQQHHEEGRTNFETLVLSALRNSDAGARDQRTVREAIGVDFTSRPSDALMSHLPTRHRAAETLFQQLQPLWASGGERQWFFGTLLSDVGNSLAYAPHLEIGRLQRDARKMLALVGMHSIGVLDLRLAHYPLRGHGDTVEAHIHLLGYIEDTASTARNAEETIGSRAVLSNWLGAPVADFKALNSVHDVERYCHYMFKAPVMRAGLVPSPLKRSGFRIEQEQVGRWGALRLAEILSHLSLRQAVFAHGTLLRPKNQWTADLQSWAGNPKPKHERDYPRAFARIWDASSVRRARAPAVCRFDARQPVDGAWNAAMQHMFAKVATSQAHWDALQAQRRTSRLTTSNGPGPVSNARW